MQFVDFPEANTVLLAPKGQEETCGDLPVFNDGEISVSCWTPNPEELEEINRTGKVWVMIFGGKSQPPMSVMGQYPFIITEPTPEQTKEIEQRVDAAQQNNERILALLDQEATCELDAQRGLDIKGYFGKWRKAQVSIPLDSPTYWNDVRMMFLELGGQLLPEGEEDMDDQPLVIPDHLANGTPEQNARFVKAFNDGPDNLSAN